MQARRIARELALLSISQLPTQTQNLELKTIDDMITAAVRSLNDEVKEMLITASAELQRGQDRMLHSETRAADLVSAQSMVREAITLTQTAINRVGHALDFPELIQFSQQKEVRHYTLELLRTIHEKRSQLDETISNALIDWQVNRLARIDRDILRLAVGEIVYLGVPDRVAINEAVELAKRYSGEDGYKYINGVLGSVAKQLKGF
jgi:transcription antitermination protein NusB